MPLTVVNVADPPPGLRLHLRSAPAPIPTLAVTNRSVPLVALETPSSPTAITLNIPTNASAEKLLSRILTAHHDGNTRRNCNPSPPLSFAPMSPSPPITSSLLSSPPTDRAGGEKDLCGDGSFVEFEMVTGPVAPRRVRFLSPPASAFDDSSSDCDSETTTEEESTNSSGFSTLSSSTLVGDDNEGHFRIHEFTAVNKLIGASPAMHRSSFFVLPREDRRRPSYHHRQIKRRSYLDMTRGQYLSQSRHDDETSCAAATETTFNFGFDADPYLDEDFGVLARQQERQQLEAEAREHARSFKIVEPAKRTTKDFRKPVTVGKSKWKKLVRRVPVPHCKDLDSPADTTKTTGSNVKSGGVRRVPVPRYEEPDTTTSATNTEVRAFSCTEESGSELRKVTSSEPWIATEREVFDLVWGDRPIDLAQYWGKGKQRMIID